MLCEEWFSLLRPFEFGDETQKVVTNQKRKLLSMIHHFPKQFTNEVWNFSSFKLFLSFFKNVSVLGSVKFKFLISALSPWNIKINIYKY